MNKTIKKTIKKQQLKSSKGSFYMTTEHLHVVLIK